VGSMPPPEVVQIVSFVPLFKKLQIPVVRPLYNCANRTFSKRVNLA